MEIRENKFLVEKMHIKELSSGAKCYIIPKEGYIEKQAIVAFNYGSADSGAYPDGIAHFMEHKLFEDKEVNVFEQFVRHGGDVNAFTNYTNTAYYFTCTDNFEQNFKTLLNFVQTPYFTEENVEKEKGIITQEINMYNDDPFWRGYIKLMELLYHANPVRDDIAGTEESISKITDKMLYECYEKYYNPGNMAVICVGDIEPNEVTDIAEALIKKKSKYEQKKSYPEEQDMVKGNREEVCMSLSMPLFNIGFKDANLAQDIAVRMAAGKIAIDLIAGEGSDLYEKLYSSNLIDDSFSSDYAASSFYGYGIISGVSDSPDSVYEAVNSTCETFGKNGFSDKDFYRIRNKHMGNLKRMFNSIGAVSQGQVDFFANDKTIFHLVDAYEKITPEDVFNKISSCYKSTGSAVSIVK